MIFPGELREKVQMFKRIKFPNDSGGGTYNEEKYLDTFAKVEEISSGPELIAEKELVQNSLKVTIRYRTDVVITNGDLMKWRGFDFVLNNFKVDPMRTKIEMFLGFNSGSTKRTSL